MSQLTPQVWYHSVCEQSGFVCDAAQLAAIDELACLWQQLVEF